jgi:hypothetical protein
MKWCSLALLLLLVVASALKAQVTLRVQRPNEVLVLPDSGRPMSHAVLEVQRGVVTLRGDTLIREGHSIVIQTPTSIQLDLGTNITLGSHGKASSLIVTFTGDSGRIERAWGRRVRLARPMTGGRVTVREAQGHRLETVGVRLF